jgi:hypothetical protein
MANFALTGGNASFFPNIDPNTGLPILKASAIDAELKRHGNVLTANNSNIRDAIYGTGWNAKSDAVNVLNGAAIFGITKGPAGMGGFQYQTPSGKSVTDTDFINAAKKAGIDPTQFYHQEIVGMGGKQNVLDKNAVYNALQDKGKDYYSITNAIDRTGGRGSTDPHATILFKADGSGNLDAVTNPQTSQPAVNYFNTVSYNKDPGILADLAPFLMLAPAIGGILGDIGGFFGADAAAVDAAIGDLGATELGVGALDLGALDPEALAGGALDTAGLTTEEVAAQQAAEKAAEEAAAEQAAEETAAQDLQQQAAQELSGALPTDPTAPGYQIGPEGPAQIGNQEFPINPAIKNAAFLQDLKNMYSAYQMAKQGAGILNLLSGPGGQGPGGQGPGGINPATGLLDSSTGGIPTTGVGGGTKYGALPTEAKGSVLPGAPVGPDTPLQPAQLQQLSPELGSVDPRLLAQLLTKARQQPGGASTQSPQSGGQQPGSSYYTYGALPAQDATMGGAGSLLSGGSSAGQYDPLGSAGLRQLSSGTTGYKDGGNVETQQAIEDLSPLELSLLQKAYNLHKHDMYGTNKYPSGQDNVVSPLAPWQQPIEDMPGDFKNNTLRTDIGDRIANDPYRPDSMDTLTGDWDEMGLRRQEKINQRYYAKGGDAHIPEFITGKTGFYVEGRGDGQSDSIPAMLADGEYVFDADTVAALGNGSNKAGAQVLDKMRQSIRKHKRSASHKNIPPKAKSPLEYLKG